MWLPEDSLHGDRLSNSVQQNCALCFRVKKQTLSTGLHNTVVTGSHRLRATHTEAAVTRVAATAAKLTLSTVLQHTGWAGFHGRGPAGSVPRRTEAAVTSVAAAAATSSGTPRSASAAADAVGADTPLPATRAALVGVPAGVGSRARLVGVLAALPAPPLLRSEGPACGRCGQGLGGRE